MTDEEAIKLLAEIGIAPKSDGRLFPGSMEATEMAQFVHWVPGQTVCIDGHFKPKQLQAIAYWVNRQ